MANHNRQLSNTVTLSGKEYLHLKQQAEAYRTMAAKIFEMPLRDPINRVIADFRSTNLYTDEFLVDLEDGLRKSSYVKKYADQVTQKRH